MKQPTYQQISELYHELWELQHKLDDVESERNMLNTLLEQETQYSEYLTHIIFRSREALKKGQITLAKQELNKV